MVELINKLILLNVAHSIALEYDSVPNLDKEKEIRENMDFPNDRLTPDALSEYEGYSPYDLVQEIKQNINLL